jgi:hypothetical protein
MVLVGGASLQEKAAPLIEHKHRKGTVEPSLGMGAELVGRALWAVGLVYQHDGVGHEILGEVRGKRISRVRRADRKGNAPAGILRIYFTVRLLHRRSVPASGQYGKDS